MLADDPDAADETVPATIHALLAARIDRLEPGERSVLQRASVEGRLFHRGAVAELLPDDGAAGLGGILLALTRKELLRPDRSLYAGDDGFRFNHVLIRDVAYASMPKEIRADLHARLASWLEAHAARRWPATRRSSATTSSRRTSPGGARPRGCRFARSRPEGRSVLGRAGRRALDRDESAAAASLLERASRLLAVDPPQRTALLTDLGRALRGTGALEAADEALGEAIDDARRHHDEPTELRAEIERARLAFMRGPTEPDAARAVARRAIAVFEPMGSDATSPMPGRSWASPSSPLATGAHSSRRSSRAASRGRLRRHAPPDRVLERGRRRDALRADAGRRGARVPREELTWARERGLAAVEADALLGGPYLYSRLGRFDEARDQLERSKSICRELGIAYGLAEAHMAGAEMEMLAGTPRPPSESYATRSGSRRRWARRTTSPSTAPGSPTSSSSRVATRTHSSSSSRRGTSSERRRSGRPPARACSRIAARRRRPSPGPRAAASLAGSDDITRTPRSSSTSPRCSARTATSSGRRMLSSEAIALHEEKGNVLSANRCRGLLADLGPSGPQPDATSAT